MNSLKIWWELVFISDVFVLSDAVLRKHSRTNLVKLSGKLTPCEHD